MPRKNLKKKKRANSVGATMPISRIACDARAGWPSAKPEAIADEARTPSATARTPPSHSQLYDAATALIRRHGIVAVPATTVQVHRQAVSKRNLNVVAMDRDDSPERGVTLTDVQCPGRDLTRHRA